MEDCFKLLHFHLGSQIPNIRIVKAALNEAARIYVELVKAGAGLEYLDIGGGLGVDYDGSQTNFESSVNYTLRGIRERRRLSRADGVRRCRREAPDDRLGERARDRGVSQRAGVQRARRLRIPRAGDPAGRAERGTGTAAHRPARDATRTSSVRNALESYHDAQQALEMALNLFTGGYLPLEQRCQAETLYWAICSKLQRLVRRWTRCRKISRAWTSMLADTYFCNFSLFQSMPDSWAIKQLFPVMPIHRLNEAADQPRGARRHHLRLGRQDRSVHRPARRQAHAAAARRSTASRTTSACS